MAKVAKHCNHVLANGVLCGAKPLRDNDFCYWHHKARTNLRARTTAPEATSTGIVLPLLEDANGIQMALQQITQAVLDGRLDNRRAGLLLYSLQLAMMNVKNVETDPDRVFREHDSVIALGEEEPSGFNDALNGNPCLGHCTTCAEPDCSDRVLPQSPDPEQPVPVAKIEASADVARSRPVLPRVILSAAKDPCEAPPICSVQGDPLRTCRSASRNREQTVQHGNHFSPRRFPSNPNANMGGCYATQNCTCSFRSDHMECDGLRAGL